MDMPLPEPPVATLMHQAWLQWMAALDISKFAPPLFVPRTLQRTSAGQLWGWTNGATSAGVELWDPMLCPLTHKSLSAQCGEHELAFGLLPLLFGLCIIRSDEIRRLANTAHEGMTRRSVSGLVLPHNGALMCFVETLSQGILVVTHWQTPKACVIRINPAPFAGLGILPYAPLLAKVWMAGGQLVKDRKGWLVPFFPRGA